MFRSPLSPSRAFLSFGGRRLALLPIGLVLIIAACGGDDDGDVGSAPATTGNYEADLTALIIDTEDRLDAETDGLTDLLQQRAEDEEAETEEEIIEIFKDVIREIFPRTSEILERAIDGLEDLNPTSQFADDHDRFVQGLKDLLDAQRDVVSGLDEIETLDDFEGFGDEGEALETELEASLSPAYLALVAAFFEDEDDDDDDADDDAAAAAAEEEEEAADDSDGATVSDGTNALSTGDELPDAYPESLIPPQSTLTSSIAVDGPDGANILTFWNSTASAKEILDFFEDAFPEAGIRGEINRFQVDEIGTLEVVDGNGDTLAALAVTGNGDGGLSLIITLNDF